MSSVENTGTVISLGSRTGTSTSGRYENSARSDGGGGGMDDILKRLGNVESAVSDIRAQVSGIAATVQHLATKADVSEMQSALIKWTVGTLIACAGLAAVIAGLIVKLLP